MINSETKKLEELQNTVRQLAHRGWCPATGGNFSLKLRSNRYAITASGVDKTTVTTKDLLIVDGEGEVVVGLQKPSAETLLHLALYRLESSVGAVLHVHTVANTILAMDVAEDFIELTGYEMLKAIKGVSSHEATVRFNILDNSQDMNQLSDRLKMRWNRSFRGGFIVRGHGVYAWGKDLAEAKRHLEGIEFLLNCELQRRHLK